MTPQPTFPPANDELAEAWHSQPVEVVARELGTRLAEGLTPAEAAQRLARYGPNELRQAPPPPLWRLVLAQFSSFVVMMLIVASAVSALLGEWVEASAILAIVVLNAIIGVVQETRAEQALAALKKL